MTSVPSRIVERRAELERRAEEYRQGAAASDDLIAEIDFINGEWLRAEAPNAHAPEAENAPAGSVEASGADMGIPISPALIADEPKKPRGPVEEDGYPGSLMPPKKPRAPKRDIRAMVLDEAERRPDQSLLPAQIAQALDVPLRAVVSAIACWQAKGRLTLDGGVVRLVTYADDPVEITGQGEVEAQDMGFPPPEMGRQALVGFLTSTPDSTMDEIREVGIDATVVYRAEKEGVVIAKAHGLYALAESEQRAAE